MALPRQVQAQLAEVEELEKTLNAQTEAPKKKKAKEPKVSEVTPEDTEAEVPVEAEAAVEPEDAKPADTSPTDVVDELSRNTKPSGVSTTLKSPACTRR